MELNELREKVNVIDDKMLELFMERMDCVRQIGLYKKENSLPVYNAKREAELLLAMTKGQTGEMAEYISTLFTLMITISRSYQYKIIGDCVDAKSDKL